jgi:hypothetical protein
MVEYKQRITVADTGAATALGGYANSGVHIGDFTTVVKVFKDAPRALSTLIRAQDFSSLIAERTRAFTGREHVFAAIRASLADEDFPSGYILLRGEPGIGKTAILSQLVKRMVLVHHFNVAPLGIRSPQAFLANTCAQLIVRYGLDYASLPPEATQDGGFLSRLLAEVAEKPENRPVVVAVDALDEAEAVGLPPGANRLFLPQALPQGAYFVLSTREEADSRLLVDSRRDIHMRDNDPQNLKDVEEFILEYIESNRECMDRRIAEWRLTEDDFVAGLVDKSEGNFMYLVHVLRDIAKGGLTATTVNDITELPQGLQGYYSHHWNDMRSSDQESFRMYQQPVVCLLATAREPVSFRQLLAWTKHFWMRQQWDVAALDPTIVQNVLTAWQEFLNGEAVDGERFYRVYHASFQEFLANEIGLITYHDTIAETALAKIPGFIRTE